MNDKYTKPYPTILGAIHLIVLYIFIQTIIDFPLALWDYYHGTSYISHPVKRILLTVISNGAILIYAYKRAKAPLAELFPLKRFNPLVFIPIILFLLSMQIFITPVNNFVVNTLVPPSWFLELFDNIFDNKYGFWGILFRVAILAPIIEELIFRGVIVHGLMRNYPKIVTIFFSGLLFALFHLNPWQFPATFCMGCLLGWLMIITNNIFACITGHALNNLIVLLYIKYNEQIDALPFFQLSENTQLYIGIGLGLLSLAGMAFFMKRNKANVLDYKKFKPNYYEFKFPNQK